MRILAASDIHGRYEVYDWLVHLAISEHADAVVLAGDLLGYPDGYESVEAAQAADRDQVHSRLARLDLPVFYIMGNDDWVELEAPFAHHESIHGRRIECKGFNFLGYQYSLPFMGGVHEKPEEEIGADLAALESMIDEQTILVTHTPAHGILDRGVLDQHAGSSSLGETIQRCNPRAHLHGHIHRDFGRVDRHFNVASGGAKRAMLIELDTLKHRILEAHSDSPRSQSGES
jgi:Icc-related predicted phosphoesterase